MLCGERLRHQGDHPPLHPQPLSVLSLQAARRQVAAAVGSPLLPGCEESHWIAATSSIKPLPTRAQLDRADTPGGSAGAGASTASSRVEEKRTTGTNSRRSRSGIGVRNSAACTASGTAASTEIGRRTAVDVPGRASARAFPAERKDGRDPGKTPFATASTVPVRGATPVAIGSTDPTDHRHPQIAPHSPGSVETQGGTKKRRTASAVERLRGFSAAKDGSGDERPSGKRAPGAGDEGCPHGRKSKRSRQPTVPWTG